MCAGDPQGEATKTPGVDRVRGPGDVPKRESAHRPEDGGRLLREGLQGLQCGGFWRDPQCLMMMFYVGVDVGARDGVLVQQLG